MATAGSGSRLSTSVSKTLMELGGTSLVRCSVLVMRDGGVGHVVVTTPEGCLSISEAVLSEPDGITCTVGGTERQNSARLGFDVLSKRLGSETIVLIHDTAHPLVSLQVVTTVLRAVAHGAEAAIPVAAIHDSTRQVGDDGSRIVSRSALRAIQTPQGARPGLLREAHEYVARYGLAITDDTSTVEALRHRAVLVPGHHDALKVTE